jgi:hypothetical protein
MKNIDETAGLQIGHGSRGGLAIVAMRQSPRGFCNLSYKMSQKEAFRNFLEIFVWNPADAFLSQSAPARINV